MREIKFRVWDDHFKYMNYKVTVGMWGKESLNDDNYTACAMYVMPDKVDYKCEPHWAHFEPYMEDTHLMQYTGLKDRNGKEIYEGDIVRLPAYLNNYTEYAVCKWIDNTNSVEDVIGFAFEDTKGKRVRNDEWEDYEIIGNIYENPELLGDD